MQLTFIYSLQSEWLKRKHSAATWLVLIGSIFIPLIITIGHFVEHENFKAIVKSDTYWQDQFLRNWEPMAIFLLPLGIILTISLITQIEYRNNTWKQVFTLPQSLTTIFFAKLCIVLFMMLQFFILFNIGIYLSGVIPIWFIDGVQYPTQNYPWKYCLERNAFYFLDCLPIIALQYLLSLKFKNFMVPLAVGVGIFVTSLIAISWKYNFTVPYIYCTLFQLGEISEEMPKSFNIHWLAFIYFVGITLGSYILFLFKKERG